MMKSGISLHSLLKNFVIVFSLDHLPANNKSEIFVALDFAVNASVLRRLCSW